MQSRYELLTRYWMRLIWMIISLEHLCIIIWMEIFQIHSNFSEIKRNIHDNDIRNADDIQVPYDRLDIRRFSSRIAGAYLWNPLPLYVKIHQYAVSSTKRHINNDRWVCDIRRTKSQSSSNSPLVLRLSLLNTIPCRIAKIYGFCRMKRIRDSL